MENSCWVSSTSLFWLTLAVSQVCAATAATAHWRKPFLVGSCCHPSAAKGMRGLMHQTHHAHGQAGGSSDARSLPTTTAALPQLQAPRRRQHQAAPASAAAPTGSNQVVTQGGRNPMQRSRRATAPAEDPARLFERLVRAWPAHNSPAQLTCSRQGCTHTHTAQFCHLISL